CGGTKPNGTANPDLIYAARGNVIYVRTGAPGTAGGAFRATKPITNADTIWDFAVDPKDWHIAYAVSSTRVYKTTDAWLHYNSVNLTGPPRSDSYRNLKSLSLTDLRTVELIQLPGQKAGQGVLLVGGQGG